METRFFYMNRTSEIRREKKTSLNSLHRFTDLIPKSINILSICERFFFFCQNYCVTNVKFHLILYNFFWDFRLGLSVFITYVELV